MPSLVNDNLCTLDGYAIELPLRNNLIGMRRDQAANPNMMNGPALLDWFLRFAKSRWTTRLPEWRHRAQE